MSAPTEGTRKGLGASLDGASDPTAAERTAASRLVDRSDEPADYGRWGRNLIWPSVVIVIGTFGMVAGGIELWRAVVLSSAGAVTLWALIATMGVPEIAWHEDVPGDSYRTSSTWEVSGLTSARESDEAFAHYVRPRLWSLAEAMLARRGIDPTSDRARNVVGPAHYAILTGEQTDPRRVISSVSALCHTVAHLAVDPIEGTRTPLDAPSLRGLAGGKGSRVEQQRKESA